MIRQKTKGRGEPTENKETNKEWEKTKIRNSIDKQWEDKSDKTEKKGKQYEWREGEWKWRIKINKYDKKTNKETKGAWTW